MPWGRGWKGGCSGDGGLGGGCSGDRGWRPIRMKYGRERKVVLMNHRKKDNFLSRISLS